MLLTRDVFFCGINHFTSPGALTAVEKNDNSNLISLFGLRVHSNRLITDTKGADPSVRIIEVPVL